MAQLAPPSRRTGTKHPGVLPAGVALCLSHEPANGNMKQTQLHALIIDDEAQVRSFIGLVLSSEGWDVSEAESAERAFEMLHTQNWSLVLCDVLLGGESGFSVLKRFREELPEKQVVLMTGRGSALDAPTRGRRTRPATPRTSNSWAAARHSSK